MTLEAYERETTVVASDGDGLVRIWTAQRSVITRCRNDVRFTEVGSGFHGSTAWAKFTIPAERWSPVSGAKANRKPHTPERREALRAHLASLRENHASETEFSTAAALGGPKVPAEVDDLREPSGPMGFSAEGT